jgi:hypothetical protein
MSSSQCDAGLDSNVGAQLDYRFSEPIEASLQATAYRKGIDHYEPQLTLGYLRWHASDQFTLRLGRMQNPTFLYSEYRMLHYAQPWVRPPREVYSIAPVFLYDGGEAIYRNWLNDWEFEFQGGAGVTKVDLYNSSGENDDGLDVRLAFLNLSVEHDDWLFKVSYLGGAITQKSLAIRSLFDQMRALNPLIPGLAERANRLEMDDKRFDIVSFGSRYETATWLMVGEYARLWMDAYYRTQEGAYLTLGYRSGPWMPYLSFARRWSHGTRRDQTIPRGLNPELDALARYVDGLFWSTQIDNTSVAVGLSRELTNFITLKVQADWIHPEPNGYGPFLNHSRDYDFTNPEDEVLFTLNLDFVF